MPSPSYFAEQNGRMQRNKNKKRLCRVVGDASDNQIRVRSLSSLCLDVVVAHLERYAPESFSILSEEDFDQVIRLRHDRTSPLTGSGGLDGSGRVAPAVPDRFLSKVEALNPHLAESDAVDKLVWRDCVNFRFREGGLTRPPALLWPWPILVEKIRVCAEILSRTLESPEAEVALRTLELHPMNVPLLQATGAGKTVKKAIKFHKKRKEEEGERAGLDPTAGSETCLRLERLLSAWVAMAEDQDGVSVGEKTSSTTHVNSSGSKDESANKKLADSLREARNDLRIVEGCRSWRQLFRALKLRDDSRRSDQGERMRKIRTNLARDRPRVVKVRPAPPSARQDRILARPEDRAKLASSSSSSHGVTKISKLWKETAVTAMRQQRTAPTSSSSSLLPPGMPKRPPSWSKMSVTSHSSSASFGAAVAIASASKRPSSKGGKGNSTQSAAERAAKTTALIKLPGGKEMRVPNSSATANRHHHRPPPAGPQARMVGAAGSGTMDKSKTVAGRR